MVTVAERWLAPVGNDFEMFRLTNMILQRRMKWHCLTYEYMHNLSLDAHTVKQNPWYRIYNVEHVDYNLLIKEVHVIHTSWQVNSLRPSDAYMRH